MARQTFSPRAIAEFLAISCRCPEGRISALALVPVPAPRRPVAVGFLPCCSRWLGCETLSPVSGPGLTSRCRFRCFLVDRSPHAGAPPSLFQLASALSSLRVLECFCGIGRLWGRGLLDTRSLALQARRRDSEATLPPPSINGASGDSAALAQGDIHARPSLWAQDQAALHRRN